MKKNLFIAFIFCLSTLINFSQNALAWAGQMGSAYGPEDCITITTDASGNVFTAGWFKGISSDFDPGPGTFTASPVGDYDAFICKTNAAGNLVWAKTFGGTGIDAVHAITVDATGNVYVTGQFDGTCDFDPSPVVFNISSASASTDAFILKLDALGNFVWAKNFEGSQTESGNAIALDPSANVYVGGSYKGTVDFDPSVATNTITAADDMDIFICKLNSSGNFIWAKSIGGVGKDDCYGLTVDQSSNIYTTGYFSNAVDFDPGAASFVLSGTGGSSAFVSKLDANGNFVLARHFTGNLSAIANAVTVDALGNIYMTGNFAGSCDFDPGVTTYTMNGGGSGTAQVFVIKLNPSGNFNWARQMGGTMGDKGFGITTDGAGNVYTTGYFIGTADFDPGAPVYNLNGGGIYPDIFISKLDLNGDFVWAGSFVGSDDDQGSAIALDASGNIFVTGHFFDFVDFDPGPGNYSLNGTTAGIFILKLAGDITSVHENRFEGNNSVYPNPASEFFNVKLNHVVSDAQIEMYNSLGQLILKQTISAANSRINTAQLGAGLYTYRIIDNNAPVTQGKIIIE
jgi:hypothetical protein